MKPKRQQLVIATACGWTEIKPQRLTSGLSDYATGKLHGKRKDGSTDYFVPYYPRDLNAMHEAIMSQPIRVKLAILCELEKMLAGPCDTKLRVTFATAAQLSEAFLRALGLWEEA